MDFSIYILVVIGHLHTQNVAQVSHILQCKTHWCVIVTPIALLLGSMWPSGWIGHWSLDQDVWGSISIAGHVYEITCAMFLLHCLFFFVNCLSLY